MFALDGYESSLCPCGCGQPVAVASDPLRTFDVQSHTCYARRALDQVQRSERKKSESQPEGAADGISWFINDSFVRDRTTGG